MSRGLIFSFVLLLGGCASVFHDDRQVISVRAMCMDRSVPAACVAENSKGSWKFQAPNDVVVAKDLYALRVTCRSVLVGQHTVHAPATLQGAMAGNVLLGGVVGAAVDASTGRGLLYPERVDVSYPACNNVN